MKAIFNTSFTVGILHQLVHREQLDTAIRVPWYLSMELARRAY
jgi:hypothetical protein